MRFRAISSLAFSIVFCGSAMFGTILASGCGSGHQTTIALPPTPTPSPTPTPAAPTTVKATILWPQRSRQTTIGGASVQIAALSSASSAVITFVGAALGGGDIVIFANRPAGPSATATTYTSTAAAQPGTYPLKVQFYNLPLTAAGALDPAAVVVATAQANTQILNSGTLSATITTIGQIKSIVVTPGQTLALGATAPAQYTAYGTPVNGQSTIIPVVAGVEQVSVANVDTTRPPVLTVVNGVLQGTYPGQARVTVTIDNLSSDPTAASSVVTVVSSQTITISPNPASVAVGGQLKLTATTTNPASSPVTWSLATDLATAASGVTIDPVTGMLTAPNRSGGPYTVIATSQYDPTKSSTASVTVTSGVTIVPNGALSVFIGANKSVSLPVTVSGTSNTAVTYTIVGNTATSTANGTITADGTYTAPNAQGVYTVIATSQADTAQTVTFTVNVNPSVTINPHKTTISVDQTVSFFANVVGGTNSNVTFSVVEPNGGTVTAGGAYTAPNVAGTYHVTATSVADPTETDTATVVVQAGSGVIVIN